MSKEPSASSVTPFRRFSRALGIVVGLGVATVFLPMTAAQAGPDDAVPIAEIQGSGSTSPLSGERVLTHGVVTANYPTGGFNGFYLQTPGSGGTIKTDGQPSDGVFVYGRTDVTVGECYRVTASVTEYRGLTELTNATLEKDAGSCASAKPVRLRQVPVTDVDKERYEGMLVLPSGAHIVTNNYQLNQYGQLGLTPGNEPLRTATDVVAPEQAAAFEEAQQARYITLDDGASWDYLRNSAAQDSPLPYLSQSTPMRTNSTVYFTRPVVLDYRFQWNYQPTSQVVGSDQRFLRSENDRPAKAPSVGGDLQLATFNVLNYFTDLGQDEEGCDAFEDRDGNPVTADYCQVRGAYTSSALNDQQRKIVRAINGLDAEVVALMEVENSAALTYASHPRDRAVSTLVAALNSEVLTDTDRWAYVPSPVVSSPGEDIIRTAFIYKPNAVTTMGASEILLDDSFANARYPLAQRFAPADGVGQEFVAVANHFKSKGSGADDGTGQGLSNPSREAQARALIEWVQQAWAGDPVFLMGDFNAYSKETPVQIIERADFTNAVQRFGSFSGGNQPSATYQFGGRLGSLDHVFANPAAVELVTGAGVWDINADESVAMQYSRRNYNVVDFYRPHAYAASDHDPALVGVRVR